MILNWWRDHGTKILGFAQVTLGSLAVADGAILHDLFGSKGQSWILLLSGVLTAWRGFVNTANLKRDSA